MAGNREPIERLYRGLPTDTKEMFDRAIAAIVSAKEKGGKVVVVTGSGPNLHEGITTLIAELIHKGIVDGVTTSSAVIAHEMAGALEEVKRVDGIQLGFSEAELPRGNVFEVNLMPPDSLEQLKREMLIDTVLLERVLALDGKVIIKAAGNMAYPLGLRTENLAKEILFIAKGKGVPFFEHKASYHGVPPSDDELSRALEHLGHA